MSKKGDKEGKVVISKYLERAWKDIRGIGLGNEDGLKQNLIEEDVLLDRVRNWATIRKEEVC